MTNVIVDLNNIPKLSKQDARYRIIAQLICMKSEPDEDTWTNERHLSRLILKNFNDFSSNCSKVLTVFIDDEELFLNKNCREPVDGDVLDIYTASTLSRKGEFILTALDMHILNLPEIRQLSAFIKSTSGQEFLNIHDDTNKINP